MTVENLTGLAGGRLAGVLFRGREVRFANAVGGFGAPIADDPATITQVVTQPRADYLTSFFPWPPVSSQPLTVEPGSYVLALWALPDPKECCYSAWFPGDSTGLRSCATTFVVPNGKPVTLTVHEPPTRATATQGVLGEPECSVTDISY